MTLREKNQTVTLRVQAANLKNQSAMHTQIGYAHADILLHLRLQTNNNSSDINKITLILHNLVNPSPLNKLFETLDFQF